MTPEVIVLLINVFGLAIAYGAVYPRLVPITLRKIMIADAAVTAVLVGVSVAWFWNTGTEFWLFGWYVSSAIFALITLLIVEIPLFSWFSKKHNISF